MPADRMSANRNAIAKLLRPGELCEVCVDVRLPGAVHVTTAGTEGSLRYRLVQALRDRASWPARYCCLVTDQRVMFAFRQTSQEFAPVLEVRPQDITAAVRRRAWPGWQVVIEFSDASAVSLDVSGMGASTAANQLTSLLARPRAPETRAQQALTSNGASRGRPDRRPSRSPAIRARRLAAGRERLSAPGVSYPRDQAFQQAPSARPAADPAGPRDS